MKARGCTRAEIARAIKCSPSHVGEIIATATRKAITEARSQTVDELLAEHRAERHARVQALHALLQDATCSGDRRTRIEALRELRHEAKEDRELMDKLGVFDWSMANARARVEKPPGQEGLEIIQEALRELVEDLGAFRPEGELSSIPTGATH